MSEFGQPENQEASEVKLEAGTEAIQPPAQETTAPAEDTVELKWGRETRSVPQSLLDGLAEHLQTSREAAQTWLQMGRDANRIYNESRERERHAQQLIEKERAAWAEEKAKLSTPAQQTVKRRSVADDPVAFWDEVATKLDKLDNLGRLDKVENMLERAVARMDQEREALNEVELQNQYVSEHKMFMDEMKERKLPYVDPDTLAQVIDRYIKDVPEGTSIRDVIEAGYRIATWEKVGKAPSEPRPRRTSPAPVITAAPVVTAAERAEGGPKPNETLEERRARLHRQVGGIRVGEFTGAIEQ